jgi:Zn-dependent peptidase ImmA (M78 family)/plasmid maintenance system antidote protein VapI
MQERGLSPSAFAEATGIHPSVLNKLIVGDEPISDDLARRLSNSIGGSIDFWLRREDQYRQDLAQTEADRWSASLPVASMTALGWIDRPEDWRERIASCLEFFNVPNVAEWNRTYGSMLAGARFRMSRIGQAATGATAAWLREAELEAGSVDCEPWNPDAFREALPQIKSLTRLDDPRQFLPKLITICAAAGVAIAVVRAPQGCPVNGAARYLVPDRPHIALSGRYLSDDHFWFTFFHEAGHLLLHDPGVIYVDEFEQRRDTPTDKEEREADYFAANVLVPLSVQENFPRRLTPADVHRLAREAGISMGIIVGQLQHSGVVRYDSALNRLKYRYQWRGPSLEKA